MGKTELIVTKITQLKWQKMKIWDERKHLLLDSSVSLVVEFRILFLYNYIIWIVWTWNKGADEEEYLNLSNRFENFDDLIQFILCQSNKKSKSLNAWTKGLKENLAKFNSEHREAILKIIGKFILYKSLNT